VNLDAPKRVTKESVAEKISFDSKTKLDAAYAKILNQEEQPFDKQLETAIVMERWSAVVGLIGQYDAVTRLDTSLAMIEKASSTVGVPMIWVLEILKKSDGPLDSGQFALLSGILKRTIDKFGGADLLMDNVTAGFLGIGGKTHEGKKAAYNLLLGLGFYDEATKFLITTEDAERAKDDKVVYQHFAAL
jgi:hypothetical protein